MPDLNGLEIYRAIQEFTPVMIGVIITGSKSTKNVIKALRLGFDDFVVKPFTTDWLSLTVPGLWIREEWRGRTPA